LPRVPSYGPSYSEQEDFWRNVEAEGRMYMAESQTPYATRPDPLQQGMFAPADTSGGFALPVYGAAGTKSTRGQPAPRGKSGWHTAMTPKRRPASGPRPWR
jgi:hypothetical protein